MSLDLSLRLPACEHCGRGESTVMEQTITHNIAPMWSEAGCYDALYNSAGKRAADVVGEMAAALEAMKADPDKYRAMEPVNKWGDYDGAVEWLAKAIEAFRAHPTAVIEVWR